MSSGLNTAFTLPTAATHPYPTGTPGEVGPPTDPAVRRVLGLLGPAALGAHPFVSGNRTDLLVDYSEWIPALLRDAASATQVIDVVQFNWEDSGPGRELANILIDKARSGVEVNVLLDKTGSVTKVGDDEGRRTRALLDEMRAAGVNVHLHEARGGFLNNPLTRPYDHRKILAVDHRVAHVGGMGLADRKGKYGSWHDLALRLEGPAAAQVGAEFVATWVEAGKRPSANQINTLWNALQHPARVGAGTARVVANTPGSHTNATGDLVEAAHLARKRLWVMTPYIGDERAAKALIDARRRGVDVRVIVPDIDIPVNKLETRISKTFYADLIKSGIPIYGYPTMMHAKAWLADDRLTVGSTNLSRGGLRWYREMSASVYDAQTAAKAVQVFQGDFNRSTPVPLERVNTIGTQLLRLVRRITGLSF